MGLTHLRNIKMFLKMLLCKDILFLSYAQHLQLEKNHECTGNKYQKKINTSRTNLEKLNKVSTLK